MFDEKLKKSCIFFALYYASAHRQKKDQKLISLLFQSSAAALTSLSVVEME